MCPLSTSRQATTVTKAAIAANVHEPLDVHCDLLTKVAFDSTLSVNDPADFADLLFGKLFYSDLRTNSRLLQDYLGTVVPYAVDVRESDINALVAR
jgi:hypothetical protein